MRCSRRRSRAAGAVKDLLDEANATIGEKIEVKRVARLEGEHVVSYLHKTSPDLPAQIGVLVATAGGDEQVARGRRDAHRGVQPDRPHP